MHRANELLHDGGTGRTFGFGASLSFSSPGAAVLFFLKEEKEKNGGAKFVSFSLSEKEKRETLQPPSHSRIERNYFASTEMTSRPL